MADPDDLAPPSPAAARRGNVKCGFCECTLDSEGAIVRVGAEAKRLEKSADDNEKLREKIATLDTTIVELRAALAAAQKAPEPMTTDAPDNW